METFGDSMLGVDAGRVKRFVEKTPADAWVVLAGSREVLEWFAMQDVPALAMFGRFSDLPIAATGPRMIPALKIAVQRLVALGHRRIVVMVHSERRMPSPALFEQAFLDELKGLGIKISLSYNLPASRTRGNCYSMESLSKAGRWGE